MNIIGGLLFGFGASELTRLLMDTHSIRKQHEEKIPITKKELNGILIYSAMTLIGAVIVFLSVS